MLFYLRYLHAVKGSDDSALSKLLLMLAVSLDAHIGGIDLCKESFLSCIIQFIIIFKNLHLSVFFKFCFCFI